MTAILYPVAATAEAALHAALGYAARAREAQEIAADRIVFVTELVGPAFSTHDAALDAYAGRIDDERPGRAVLPAEARWRELVPVSSASGLRPPSKPPVKPVYEGGRRWPLTSVETALFWRLSVSYWRIGANERQGEIAGSAVSHDAARRLRRRRRGEGEDLAGLELNALARQPLRPMKPQQPLDIGLFEIRPPEAPDTLIPDE